MELLAKKTGIEKPEHLNGLILGDFFEFEIVGISNMEFAPEAFDEDIRQLRARF